MLQINPPQSDSPQEVLGVYGAVAKTFVLDMKALFIQHLEPLLGADWFSVLKVQRAPHLDTVNINDPIFYLKEPYYNDDSPVWNFMPKGNASFKNNLGKLLKIRHDWAHYTWEPTITNLSEAVATFFDVADQLKLPHSENYAEIRSRCLEIIHGSFATSSNPFSALQDLFRPTAQSVEQDSAVLEEIKQEVEIGLKVIARQKRPPIGGAWEGPPGSRVLKLVKTTRDIYDTSGKSVKSELGPNADVVIGKWLTILNGNAELKVSDEDGAIAAPLGGRLHLLGYFGDLPEPDPTQIQGFIGPEEYVVKNGQVIRVGSRFPLEFTSNDQIDLSSYEGAEVRVTTHGDVALTKPTSLERVKIGHL